MKNIFLLFGILFSLSLNAQGIEFFEGTWEEALQQAKAEEKIIFVDAFAKWCGPCKKMAATTFKDEKVGLFHKDNFISMKIDMEEPMGRQFGKKYPVAAYPTIFYIDGDGNVIKKSTGFRAAKQLVDLGHSAIKGYDKSGKYAEEYENGNRDYKLVYNYVNELNKVGKPSLKISNEYLNSKPDISNEELADFYYVAVVDADSKIFDELIESKSLLEEKYGNEDVQEKIKTACFNTIDKSIEFEYPELKEEAVKQFKTAYPKEGNKFQYEADLYYAQELNQFGQWKELNKKYLKKYGKKDSKAYAQAINTVKSQFSKQPDAKLLWMEYAEILVDLDDKLDHYFDYIKALIENQENDKALQVAQEAFAKAQSTGEDTKQIERYIKYIETL